MERVAPVDEGRDDLLGGLVGVARRVAVVGMRQPGARPADVDSLAQREIAEPGGFGTIEHELLHRVGRAGLEAAPVEVPRVVVIVLAGAVGRGLDEGGVEAAGRQVHLGERRVERPVPERVAEGVDTVVGDGVDRRAEPVDPLVFVRRVDRHVHARAVRRLERAARQRRRHEHRRDRHQHDADQSSSHEPQSSRFARPGGYTPLATTPADLLP